jgi:hypothetical protein
MHLQLESTGREHPGCVSWEVLQRKEGGAVTIHKDATHPARDVDLPLDSIQNYLLSRKRRE